MLYLTRKMVFVLKLLQRKIHASWIVGGSMSFAIFIIAISGNIAADSPIILIEYIEAILWSVPVGFSSALIVRITYWITDSQNMRGLIIMPLSFLGGSSVTALSVASEMWIELPGTAILFSLFGGVLYFLITFLTGYLTAIMLGELDKKTQHDKGIILPMLRLRGTQQKSLPM